MFTALRTCFPRQSLREAFTATLAPCVRSGDASEGLRPSLAELKMAVRRLEGHWLADHAHLLESDPLRGWTARQRREETPSVGPADGRKRDATRAARRGY